MDNPNKKQRLELLISQFGHGKKSEFARIVGVSPQAINSWLTRDSFDIELIYSKCVGLSAHWLLTGEGNMLKQQNESQEVTIYRNDPHILELVEIQRKHIKVLEEQMTLRPARLDLNVPSTESTPIPSIVGPKRAKNHPKLH